MAGLSVPVTPASGLMLLGQTDPAWPEVMIWANVVGEEMCRKQSYMNADREPEELVFKI